MKNKINVNISPNPLGLQTLHCSQNDTGERKFYFTLHNNGEVIDTTDISDPVFEPFDVYKGGTEQLLPVNTDDPTTSPIIADIQYPDEEKTEQEFTYRESPTTIDGKALVEKIKGNTLVWNQLAQNGNFTSASNWTASSGTSGSVASNVYTLTATADNQYANLYQTSFNGTASVGDKFLFSCYITSSRALTKFRFAISSGLSYQYTSNTTVSANTRTRVAQIMTITTANTYNILRVYPNHEGTIVAGDTFKIENVFCINLTKAFGSGKEPTVEEFTKLYPLPYYSYEQGKLLSFNGDGIKTVGFNQWDEEWELGVYNTSTGLPASSTSSIRCKNAISIIPSCNYCFARPVNNGAFNILWYDASDNFILYETMGSSTAYRVTTPPSNARYVRFYMGSGYGTTYNNDICINISDSSKNGTYEPYQTSTLDIPTSTYFPTGMKSAGTVYDEFTSSRAYTRVGEVDLGSLTWTYDSAYTRFRTEGINTLIKKPSAGTEVINMICPIYESRSANDTSSSAFNNIIGVATTGNVFVRNASYSDATAFKTAMNGVMLQYELAVEEVTEFTHASLICEDGESALYHDDDLLVCECTEDFSKDSGFKDCKIKYSNDDEVVYSNKIQLHIERKP